ncbi:putative D-alanine--d-alanine ligase [Leptospira ryugenii]|uniref:Putative D-alanine--d-alanine ligase n=1 Tax=Leptospira ryugenii TaxID=1917863 RepID=A0A2P2DX26_9LEPT|nr:D-alanine--D-alanine ligase [Leptospira ryugenii]GBF49183.1 putative D-alanine--d-alanine ligase [Leptospira ryugenii]
MKNILIAADLYEEGPRPWNQEWESKLSVQEIQKELEELGYHSLIYSDRISLVERLVAIRPEDRENWLVWNLIEGYQSRNREAYIPNLCEFLGIAYTGSDAYAQIVSLDKSLCKEFAKKLAIPTSNSQLLKKGHRELRDLEFPIFLKPNFEGSSLGIYDSNIIQNQKEYESKIRELFELFDEVIAEEYLLGDEITVGLLGHFPEYLTTKPARIVTPGKVYDEHTKSKSEMPETLIFDLNSSEEKSLKKYVLDLGTELEIVGPARFDFMRKDGNFYFLEANLTPGLSLRYSCLPILCESSGISKREMFQKIIDSSAFNYQNSKRFLYGKGKF